MEISLNLWKGIVGGWKPVLMIIKPEGYALKRLREHLKPNQTQISDSKFYSLDSGAITHTAKPLEFCVETGQNKNYFKAYKHDDKVIAINALTAVIKGLNSKKAFSDEYKGYKEEINKKSVNAKGLFDEISVQMTFFQNLFIEMNARLESFSALIRKSKLKKKEKAFEDVLNSLTLIREEMKTQFDELIVRVFRYHDEKEPDKAFTKPKIKEEGDIGGEENKNTNSIQGNVGINDEMVRDSILIEQINDKAIGLEDLEEEAQDDIQSNKEKVIIDMSFEPALYESELYSPAKRRLALASDIQCSKNMRSDFMKCMNMKKVVLPIYFNEPISMLQKQCEKFYYCDLLNKASEQTLPELQLCFICAFIIAEMSFITSRILKPFNPILGETYEYFDNELKFRYLAEQVSHAPPITAFIGEGKSFALYGDTRGTSSFKFLKGAVELEFGNKVHLFLKTTKDYYVYTRPLLLMKGLLIAPIRYDYSGTVTVSNVNNPAVQATMTFIEESKKNPLGSFEGRVMKDNKPLYLVGGSWTSGFYYTDFDGSNKVSLLTIEDEEFLHNTPEKYRMPRYTCDLNHLTPELEKTLPSGDSRFRPDMKAYEEGNIDLAQELRKKVEKKQSLRHIKFDEDKIKYEPVFFKNENMPQSGDSVYCYIGGYWENRKALTHKPNDIFHID